MITCACTRGHIYVPADPIVADLTGGWNAITHCPGCDLEGRTVRVYTPITAETARDLIAAGNSELLGLPLRSVQNSHATNTLGPIQQAEWGSRPLSTDAIAGDALIGAWLGQEAHHV